jgi:hypothetical protein
MCEAPGPSPGTPAIGVQRHARLYAKRPATAGDDVVAAAKKTRRRKPQISRSQRFKLKAKEVNYSGLDRVLSILQWCALNGFSEDTGRRILASGKGPKVLQLSSNRIGIRASDNKTWQDGLVRSGK